MSKGEVFSMLAAGAMLWYVRVVTGRGALNIIVDALPSLGLD